MARSAHPYYSAAIARAQCSVDGCERSARGMAGDQPMCGMHRQRWMIHGSPHLPDRRRSHDGTCTVEGCGNRVQSKNSALCATHHLRLKRRSPAGLNPVIRQCLRCSRPLIRNQSKYCSQRCCLRAWAKAPLSLSCKACGEPFEPNGRWEVCSPECQSVRDQRWKTDPRVIDQKKMRSAKRRAIKRGVQLEDFYHSEIFNRDRWICQICLLPVDRSKTFPHHLSPSIDHIVPLSKGGPHRRFNVQCAHWICNIRKSTKPMARMAPPEGARELRAP